MGGVLRRALGGADVSRAGCANSSAEPGRNRTGGLNQQPRDDAVGRVFSQCQLHGYGPLNAGHANPKEQGQAIQHPRPSRARSDTCIGATLGRTASCSARVFGGGEGVSLDQGTRQCVMYACTEVRLIG